MAKYLDLLTDFGFMKIFGEEANKDILIDFLNSLLPDNMQVKVLTFKNTESLSPEDKKEVCDFCCENGRGEKFVLDLQQLKHKYHMNRSIFYPLSLIAEQEDYNFKPVYSINFLDFKLTDNLRDDTDDNVVQRVSLKDEDGTEMCPKLQYIYLVMPEFNKTEAELGSRLDKWLYLIKNLHTFETIPEIFKNDMVFVKAMHQAEHEG